MGAVLVFDFTPPAPLPPPDCISIEELLAPFERDPNGRALLEEATRKVGEKLYAGKEHNPIVKLRLRKGWSQARLAQAIGSTQSHVARVESRERDIHISTIEKLAYALDAVPKELAADVMDWWGK